MLNLISIVGLFVMLLLAWLMSSARSKVNWRLVCVGIGLQVLLAAIFFNSQRWTFPFHLADFSALEASVENQAVTTNQLDAAFSAISAEGLTVGDKSYKTWDSLQKAVAQSDVLKSEVEQAILDQSGLWIPRFPRGIVFYVVESFFAVIKTSVDEGAKFVFAAHPGPEDDPPTHPLAILTTFAFGVLPTIIFFAALMSVLYYLGVMQILIRMMAWVMQRTLGTSGAESLAAAANVLVGHTEAPLVVKPYVASMTRSELNALMVGGFATISGSLMAIFANIGVSAGHLLTASIISAPAALVIAKILQPETETPVDVEKIEANMEQNATNLIEAAARGASEGMKLAINIAAMLIAFLALIAFIDIILQQVGNLVSLDLSLKRIFGLIFWPMAWVMGIETKDCFIAGDLLGKKMVVNEFLAYLEMSNITNGGVEGVSISERTRVILTYALCGFSNFGAIGIQLGGIGPLAPARTSDLAQLGLRAMVGGMLACSITACIAGAFYGVLS